MAEKLVDTLRLAGLTDYETKAYLVLTSFGNLTASELSEKSGIPYSRIYDVIGNLEKKQWVEIDNERPKRIYPSNPVASLSKVKNQITDNIDYAIQELQVIARNRPLMEKALIFVLKGWNRTEQMIYKLLESANDEVAMVFGFPHSVKQRTMKKLLRSLQERKIKLKVLLRDDKETLSMYRNLFEDCATCMVGTPPQLIMTYVDWETCIVTFPKYHDGEYIYKSLTSIYINHPAIIAVSEVAITSYLKDSRPLKPTKKK